MHFFFSIANRDLLLFASLDGVQSALAINRLLVRWSRSLSISVEFQRARRHRRRIKAAFKRRDYRIAA